MVSLIKSSVELVNSSFPSSSLEELGGCVKLFIENCFRPPVFSASLREIADKFKSEKEFRDFCIAHGVNIDNHIIKRIGDRVRDNLRINPNDIQPGDTVLWSAPEHCCRPEHKEGASPKLLENLELAESLIQYVQEKVPNVANYLSKTFTKDDPEHIDAFKKRLQCPSWPTAPDALKTAKSAVSKIKENKMGVCQDLALVGMLRAWRKHPDQNVEMAFLLGGRHVFLIINRKEGSNPSDYKTWGNDCVICETWAGRTYPLAKIEEELFDFLGELRDDYQGSEMSYPYMRPFDPQTQKVVICFKPLSQEDKKLILTEQGQFASIEYADPSIFEE